MSKHKKKGKCDMGGGNTLEVDRERKEEGEKEMGQRERVRAWGDMKKRD